MDPAQCARAYGPAVGDFCERALRIGFDPVAAAGWQSALAAVMAGFLFIALTISFGPQSGAAVDRQNEDPLQGGAFPLLLGAFLSLLFASMLSIVVSGEVHPLRIGPSASFAAGVFAAGAVQTFVALAWLFDNLPRTAAVGTVRSAFRFVAFFAGLYLYVTVSKVQTAVRARRWTRAEALAAILMLALPWIVARVVVRPASAVWRWSWRGVGIQKASFWFSLVFVGQMIWYAVVVNERTTVRLSSAFPWWMVAGTLLGTGLIFAVFELNMPPTIAVGRVEAHVAIVGDLEPAADAGPIAPVPPVGGAPEQVRSDRTQER